MEWIDFVDPQLLILIPVLYFIGIALKHIEKLKSNYIPLIIGAIGVLFATIWILATRDFNGRKDIFMAVFVSLVQGILCAGMSVYANQVYKQLKELKK